MTGDTKDTGTPIPDDEAGTIEEGTESVRRTIVGGRPLDRRRRKVRIPIGIEKVLCAAAADREFREQLLMARADALAGTGLEVSPSEAMILRSVSEDALRIMIENIDLKRHRRRRFFRGIAAASLAATTAMSTGCVEAEEDMSKGIAPDWPDAVTPEVQPVAGVNLQDSVDEVAAPEDIFEVGNVFYDVGNTGDVPPDVVWPEEVQDAAGSIPDVPEDVQEIQVDDVQTYAGVTLPDANAQDADEVEVEIQPMPAGIPPREDVEEPK